MQNFPTTRVFHTPAEGLPLEFCIGAGAQKTIRMSRPGGWMTFIDTIPGYTDGWMELVKQYRPLQLYFMMLTRD